MLKLGERGKTLCLLLAVQVVCLSSGLFIHHQFAVSSTRLAARQDAWSALARVCESRAQDSTDAVVVEVDLDWNVVAAQDASLSGQRLHFERRRNFEAGAHLADNELLLGEVVLAGETRLAAARRSSDPDRYLVAYSPTNAIAARPQSVANSLWYASAITFFWMTCLLGIATFLIVKNLFDRQLRHSVEKNTAALQHAESMSRMREAVIFGLAKLTESRDPETGYHLERIALFSSRLAQAMRGHRKFAGHVTPEFVKLIESSSILHDIGKVGIEDSVLLKPGPLSPQERERMQRHAIVGGKCLQDIESRLGRSNFLQMAREIAYSHHERWDGSGYPQGLKGEQIPLAARIVAVCDVYEALSSKRIYKEALPHDECVAYVRDQAGRHFDPHIVEVFLQIQALFREIGFRLSTERHAAKDSAAIEARNAGLCAAAAQPSLTA